jgi:hypothetical protein
VPGGPAAPLIAVQPVWHRAVPNAVVPYSVVLADRYRRWLRLADALSRRSPDVLRQVEFPERYDRELEALLQVTPTAAVVEASGSLRTSLRESMEHVVRLVPHHAVAASSLATALRDPYVESPPAARPGVRRAPQEDGVAMLVHRILADLG